MKTLRRGWSRLIGALIGRRRDKELAQEIETHIALQTDDNIRAGMSPAEARRAALLKFGGVEITKENLRDQRGLPRIESFAGDIRYAVRQLASQPSFTLLATLTLAIGIAASTAIFSVVYGVLLDPLPYDHPERLGQLLLINPDDGNVSEYLTGMDFLDLRDNVSSVEAIACSYNYRVTGFNLEGPDGAERVRSLQISSQFFDVYSVAPLLGRNFTEADEREDMRLAIISNRLWKNRFGGDSAVIGQLLRADGNSYEIVGVMPEGFQDVRSGQVDIWIPHNTTAGGPNSRGNYYITVVAKLADGVSFSQAQQEMQAQWLRTANERQGTGTWPPHLIPLTDEVVGKSRGVLYALLGGAGLVLLIACVNLGAMLLVRGYRRQRELATRAALGSSRWRLVQQLLTENIVLALLGGCAGMFLGLFAVEGLTLIIPDSIPRTENIAFDWRIFFIGCALTMATSLIFGWLPSWRASRVNLEGALRESFRGGTAGAAQHRLHQGLIAAQVAMAVVVLVGSGLLSKSFNALLHADLGISPENVLTFEVSPPSVNYPEGEDRSRFYSELHQRLQTLPGVSAVGATSWLPARGRFNSWGYGLAGADPEIPTDTDIRIVQGEYFKTTSIRLTAGRLFDDRDQADSTPVVIVSESLARRHWQLGEAVGKTIGVAGAERTIVGVVRDTRYDHRVMDAVTSYIPHQQYASNRNWPLTQTVKATGDPTALLRAIERELANLDSSLVIYNVRLLETVVARAIAKERFAMFLMTAFGWTSLFLAVLGIYGVLSYVVAQRTREIGIRMALGAAKREIVSSVITRALRVTAIGGLAGSAFAALGSRWIESLLYNVSPTDGFVFLSVIGVTAAAAIAASIGPATRAVHINPIEAIRQD